MISFNFTVSNPFSKQKWKTKFCRSVMLSKYKELDIQVTEDKTVIGISFYWNIKQDHAGVGLELSLVGNTMMLSISDTRHWDEDTGEFQIYE